MGEVAVLQPHDILKNRFSKKHNRSNLIQPPTKSRKPPKNLANFNPNPSSNPAKGSRQKRSQVNSRNSSRSPPKKDESNNLVMGKVKILKRGESLTDLTTSFAVKKDENSKIPADTAEALVVPVSAAPKTVAERMKIFDFYSGTAFVTSPPPSSLPLPAFCKKKSLQNVDVTDDLKRILKLDLE